MKNTIKYTLFRLGVFPLLDLIRRLPAIVRWLKAGCVGCAPAPIKRRVISAYCKRYGLLEFIETGTYLGDTLAYIAQKKNMHATSIELDENYYRAAQHRFVKYPNVTLLHGDSGKLLPELVSQLQTPALFWLDGHYSGGDTGKGELETPISAELEAILASPEKGHVILIDDARCFNGANSYPHIEDLLKSVRLASAYELELSTDIIRLTPKLNQKNT